MDQSEKADLDQSFALIGDTWPAALHRFYQNCVESGFREEQALLLTTIFFKGLLPQGNK